ncbi:YecA family protein [Planctomycetota bacterium]
MSVSCTLRQPQGGESAAPSRAVLTTRDDHTYLMIWSFCSNQGCGLVHIHLLESDEADGSPDPRGMISVSLDLETWEDLSPPGRSAEDRAVIEDLLAGLDADLKTLLREAYAHHQEELRGFAAYRMSADDVRSGALVTFTDVVSGGKGLLSGGSSYGFGFTHGETTYCVDDYYCCNPDCECKKVRVVFARMRRKTLRTLIEEEFAADLMLDGKHRIDTTPHCTRAQAEETLAVWRSSDPELPELFRDRYVRMKGLGARILAEEQQASPASAPAPPKPGLLGRAKGLGTRILAAGESDRFPRAATRRKTGRNEPCPCGSGKKYKRCCGR